MNFFDIGSSSSSAGSLFDTKVEMVRVDGTVAHTIC